MLSICISDLIINGVGQELNLIKLSMLDSEALL